MSYCVNCGVELSPDLPSCPLCRTPVVNPAADNPPAEKAFSDKIVLPAAARKRFGAYIVSMVMLIPNIVCLLTDFLILKGYHWSLFVLTSTALLWIIAVFPFYTKKLYPYLLWAFDSVAVSAYVYFFYAIGSESPWFFKCALPIIGCISLLSLIFMIWVKKKKRGKTQKAIHLLADITLCSLVTGAAVSYYIGKTLPVIVSSIVSASVFAVMLFLIYCEKSKRMKAWLSRKFFVE